jgi:hypothetical protein
MRRGGEWAEEHWDVMTIVAGLVLAVVVSLTLGVAYNVVTMRLEMAPPGRGPATPAPVFDPTSRLPTAPYS